MVEKDIIMQQEKHFINSIYYQLEQTAKYCKYLGNQLFEKLNFEIPLDEFVVLDTILVHGEICQRDLAKLILKDRPSTGRLLNSLEEKGLIERFADTKNNRLVRKTKLTAKGQCVTEQITNVLKEYFARFPVLSGEKVLDLKARIQEFKDGLEKEVEMKI
jgi:DNA-binding MarR family transcriptional regulator